MGEQKNKLDATWTLFHNDLQQKIQPSLCHPSASEDWDPERQLREMRAVYQIKVFDETHFI